VRFQPRATGTVNRGFDMVTPGPTVHCYETTFSGLILLRLDSPTSLTLEPRLGPPFTCPATGSPAFTTASVRYDR
jgi:hypothetical protein